MRSFSKSQNNRRFCKKLYAIKIGWYVWCHREKNYFWSKDKDLLTPLTEAVMNTKTVDQIYEAAHCLYAGRMDLIGKDIWMGDFRKKGDIELFTMEEGECFDIDYEWQFNLAEKIYEA